MLNESMFSVFASLFYAFCHFLSLSHYFGPNMIWHSATPAESPCPSCQGPEPASPHPHGGGRLHQPPDDGGRDQAEARGKCSTILTSIFFTSFGECVDKLRIY